MVTRPAQGDLTVYIDDGCAMCVAAGRRVARTDRHRRLHIRSLADGAGSFAKEDLTRELHAVDASGQVFRGYDALVAIVARAIASRLAPLLRSPPARRVGERCYRFVARRRRSRRQPSSGSER